MFLSSSIDIAFLKLHILTISKEKEVRGHEFKREQGMRTNMGGIGGRKGKCRNDVIIF